MASVELGWVFGLPRFRKGSLVGRSIHSIPLRCWNQTKLIKLIFFSFIAFISLNSFHYLSFLLLHCLLSLIGWLVFFFGRSHWRPAAHNPPTKKSHQSNKSTIPQRFASLFIHKFFKFVHFSIRKGPQRPSTKEIQSAHPFSKNGLQWISLLLNGQRLCSIVRR